MRVIRVINNGGFGRVEEVELPSGEHVARKVFDPEPFFVAAAGVAKLKDRFKREVKVQSALDDDFCVPVLSTGLAADPPWFTMPLADRSLRDEIASARSANTIPTTPSTRTPPRTITTSSTARCAARSGELHGDAPRPPRPGGD